MTRYLKDIFTIPESARVNDYVLRLTDSVNDQADDAITNYVITDDIADAFGTALALVSDAITTGTSRAAFLAGSFGSGKSHFMAMLHALLLRNETARARTELHKHIATHDRVLHDQNIFPIAMHMLGITTIEQGIFDSYIATVRTKHPDAPLPAVHHTDSYLADAERIRQRLGNDAFFDGLNNSATDTTGLAGLGSFGAAASAIAWDENRYNAARAATPGDPKRQELITVLSEQWLGGSTKLTDYVSLEQGLQAIATHAKTLGYDAVVLFIDELVLWLMYLVQDRPRFADEVQKLTKFVESGTGKRTIPIVSIIARQLDLRTYFADSGATGQEQAVIEDALKHQSGRFANIELGNDNLAYVTNKRLLEPKDDAAKAALEAAFAGFNASNDVWNVLLDGFNTGGNHSAADKDTFKLTYPFSPALISTLRSLAGVMQRDRTALKVMQNMLVDLRDQLTINHIIPVGDAFDYLIAGQEGAIDPGTKARFKMAADLYRKKFRPTILSAYGLDPADKNADHDPRVIGNLRLAKTLIMAAIASDVPALRGLTASRLAHLNHGSVQTLIPNTEAQNVLATIRQWAPKIPELRVNDDRANPIIGIELTEADYESIVERAASVDSGHARQRLLNHMMADQLGIDTSKQTFDNVHLHKITWRGTTREVEVVFGNIRDPHSLTEDMFHASASAWRIIIDFPTDDSNHTVADDHSRLEALGECPRTIAWVPRHLTDERMQDVGRLVILNHLLDGSEETWNSYSDHLSPNGRDAALTFLRNNRVALQAHLQLAIETSLELRPATPDHVKDPTSTQPVVRSLTSRITLSPPVGTTFTAGFTNVISQALAQEYPEHPEFSSLVSNNDLQEFAKHVRLTATDAARRVDLTYRPATIKMLANELGIGKASDVHYALDATTFTPWSTHLAKKIGAHGNNPIVVRQLRQWCCEHPVGSGLLPRFTDLIIIAWATLEQRAWYFHSNPITPPELGKLDDNYELKAQDLPSDDEWQIANRRIGVLTGQGDRTRVCTPDTLRDTSDQLSKWADQRRNDVRSLRTELTTAQQRLGIEHEGDRSEEVASALQLVETLAPLSGVKLIRELATINMLGEGDAVGKTIATAQETAEELQQYDWENISLLVTKSTDLAAARSITDELRQALRKSVFQVDLIEKLRDIGRRANDLIRSSAAEALTPQTSRSEPLKISHNVSFDHPLLETTKPSTPRRVREEGKYTITGNDALNQAYRDMLDALQQQSGKVLKLTWTLETPEDKS